MRSTLWVLVAGAIACSEPATREPEQPPCFECLKNQAIEELIDLGTAPTSGWELRFRSVEELKKRPREAVLAELGKRMGNRQFAAKYRDAFVVYALRSLLVKDLAAKLLEVYPTLDDAGRYEVLVYGVEYELASYAPLFVEILERRIPARVELRDLLAAVYAFRVPSESSLRPGLRRLGKRIEAEEPSDRDTRRDRDSGCTDFASLDGFPYRGLGLLGVCGRRSTVDYALSRIERYRPVPPMSAEEAELLARVRNALLHPERRRIAIDGLPLEEAFREFWRVFEMEPSEETLGTLRRDADKALASSITFRSDAAMASEVVAAICNQTGLRIVFPGFGAVRPGDPPMRNTCVAAGGILFQLQISTPLKGQHHEVGGRVEGVSSLDWYQLAANGFELDAAILPGGADAGAQSEQGFRHGFFSLEVDHGDRWRTPG